VAVCVDELTGVGVCVKIAVGVDVLTGVGVCVGTTVDVAVLIGVGVCVGATVDVAVLTGVGVCVGATVGVAVVSQKSALVGVASMRFLRSPEAVAVPGTRVAVEPCNALSSDADNGPRPYTPVRFDVNTPIATNIRMTSSGAVRRAGKCGRVSAFIIKRGCNCAEFDCQRWRIRHWGKFAINLATLPCNSNELKHGDSYSIGGGDLRQKLERVQLCARIKSR
jgi:hypothetical protein